VREIADAAAIELGEQSIAAGGRQVPSAFDIAYDPAKIDPRFTYAVWARSEEDGKLRFVSDRRHAVSSRGAPMQVGRVLKAVGAAALR
jgi:putative lipoprotein